MANKITITISKDKEKEISFKRSYKNKEGVNVEVSELKFELIEMKEESKKVVYDSEKFQLIKTHFAVKPQSAEDRKNKVETVYVGEGITQAWKDDNGGGSQSQRPSQQNNAPVAEDDDLPF